VLLSDVLLVSNQPGLTLYTELVQHSYKGFSRTGETFLFLLELTKWEPNLPDESDDNTNA
jgi:hypothetical protein